MDRVDLVIDCTGVFKSEVKRKPYFDAGIQKVVVSAPIKDKGVANIVYGLNHYVYETETHKIITAASCTTNCLASVIKVIHDALGIRHAR